VLAAAGVMLAAAGSAAPGRADESAPGAETVSVTIQAIWQVQQGCARDCHDTSQTQMAVQSTTAVQVAAAPDGATASNRHVTIQIVVQSQQGCLELCYGTSQLQSAVQQIDVSQIAAAIAGATNSATATQFVWQRQQGCQVECHGATSTQTGDGSPAGVAAPPPFPVELDAFRTWATALAASLSATLDFLEQHDIAACLERCTGGAQVQVGVQADVVVQVEGSGTTTATAVADALLPTATAKAPRAAKRPPSKRRTRARRPCKAPKVTKPEHSTKRSARRAHRVRRGRCAARRRAVSALSTGRRITPPGPPRGVWSTWDPPTTERHWRASSGL
jgi:hypothetical protein